MNDENKSEDNRNDFVTTVKIIGKDFLEFLKENEMIKYIGVIIVIGGVVFLSNSFLNFKVLAVIAYILGIVILAFLIFYTYKEWNEKRIRYMALKEKYEEVLDILVEEDAKDEKEVSEKSV